MSSNQTNQTFMDDWHIRDITTFATYDKQEFRKLKRAFREINQLQESRDLLQYTLESNGMSEAQRISYIDKVNMLDRDIDYLYEILIDDPVNRKLNDQPLSWEMPKPLDAKQKKDRITLNGIVIFNLQIMAQSTSRVFSHMGVGEGTTQAGPNDSGLAIEVARVNIKETGGNMKASGVTLRWDALFDILTESLTCTEAALFNGPATQSGVICGARSVLDSSQGVEHEYGNDFLYVRMIAQTLSA